MTVIHKNKSDITIYLCEFEKENSFCLKPIRKKQ